ncbi:MAG: hypothetical protein WC728_01090 [Elusimicrobiota bacterium]
MTNSKTLQIPQIQRQEKRRESKGAGIVFGQGGAAGVGVELVPSPLVQAGKILLGAGKGVGAAKAGGLAALATRLPVLMAALVTTGAACWVYGAAKSRLTVPASGQAIVFPADTRPHEEPSAGQKADSYDSLTYLIVGNEVPDKLRDSIAMQQTFQQAAMIRHLPALPPAAASKAEAPAAAQAPALIAEKEPEPARRGRLETGAADSEIALAGGSGLWTGITRKFDIDSALGRANGRLPASAAAFTLQRSRYRKTPQPASTAKRVVSGALEQLFLSHGLSRKALTRSSAEGRSYDAAQAFEKAPKALAGKVRSSAKKSSGAQPLPPVIEEWDGGPIFSPYSGKDEAPGLGQTGDESPWTPDIELAEEKLQDASELINVVGALAPLKMIPIIGAIAAAIQAVLYNTALSYSSTARKIGGSIQSDWAQPDQSEIVTTGSGITDGVAAAALWAPVAASSWSSVLAGVAVLAALIGAALAPSIIRR